MSFYIQKKSLKMVVTNLESLKGCQPFSVSLSLHHALTWGTIRLKYLATFYSHMIVITIILSQVTKDSRNPFQSLLWDLKEHSILPPSL